MKMSTLYVRDYDQDINGYTMKPFLYEVSIELNKSEEFIDNWVHAVQDKLERIGIYDVKDLMTNIIDINRLLSKDGYPMMHVSTLRTMAKVGTRYIIKQTIRNSERTNNKIHENEDHDDDQHYHERGVADLERRHNSAHDRTDRFPH